MAQANDIIDLRGRAAAVAGGGTNLVNASYNATTGILTHTMSDGTLITATIPKEVEHGGVIWIGSTDFKTGDLVTQGGTTYIAIVDSTGQSPGVSPGSWKVLTTPEYGGVPYNNSYDYTIGTIVTQLGKSYICITATTAGPFTSANWKMLEERGGILWDNTLNYRKGDVVSVMGSDQLYIAMIDNTGANPLALGTWYELHHIRYAAGLFTPTAGIEYPDITAHTDGAVFYASGLPSTGYDVLTGPLTGQNIVNNDKIVWYGTDHGGADIWFHEPYPRISGEQGGIAFDSSRVYDVGNVVTENQDLYLCLNPVAMNSTAPSATSADWRKLDTDFNVNTKYDPAMTYNEGDIVSLGTNIYVAPVGGVPINSVPPAAGWTLLGGEDEVGGVLWDNATTYKVGNVVTDNLKIYIANAINTAEQPGTGTSWTALSLTETGGLAWQNSISYNLGDVVSVNGTVYVARSGGIPAGTVPSAITSTFWATPAVAELGGRIWLTGSSYAIGDVVSFNNVAYIARTTTSGDQPNTSPVNWEAIGSNEQGGVAHDPAKNYSAGDMVTDGSKVYVCINPGITGAITSANWKLKDEIGGLVYDITTVYPKGAIVTDPMSMPVVTWISLVAGNTGNPLILGGNWQELDSIMYNAGLYTPVAGTEYPDTTGEHIGAIWYVSGLGGDSVTQEMTRYEFVDGTKNLIGIHAVDMDKVIWIDGVQGAETWLWSPFPRIHAEQGGTAWQSGRPYLIGDTVSFGGVAYISLVGNHTTPNMGTQPDISPAAWKLVSGLEKGGVAYAKNTLYATGDIIYGNTGSANGVYICATPYTSAATGNNAAFLTEIANWEKISVDATESKVDIGGWVSDISGVVGVGTGNPVTAGTTTDLQGILNDLDNIINPGTY